MVQHQSQILLNLGPHGLRGARVSWVALKVLDQHFLSFTNIPKLNLQCTYHRSLLRCNVIVRELAVFEKLYLRSEI